MKISKNSKWTRCSLQFLIVFDVPILDNPLIDMLKKSRPYYLALLRKKSLLH